MINLWIAIPHSCLVNSQTILEKSYKISQISRACSIFRVKKILVYHDRSTKVEKIDEKIILTVLEYLDTPPYLRKKIFPKMWILKHAGSLPPIKSLHHKPMIDLKNLKENEIRFGLVMKHADSLYVDVGLEKPIRYKGIKLENKKVLVKISKNVELYAEDVIKEKLDGYWGYDVHFVQSLAVLLENKDCEKLMTSIEGQQFIKQVSNLMHNLRSKNLLIIFGGPKFGLRKILESENRKISTQQYFLNLFPNQGTQTIRLEEAILGSLSIINNYLNI